MRVTRCGSRRVPDRAFFLRRVSTTAQWMFRKNASMYCARRLVVAHVRLQTPMTSGLNPAGTPILMQGNPVVVRRWWPDPKQDDPTDALISPIA
jgi:hypothetical protein